MLKKIQCDKFISKGQVRPPIEFKKGLNTILGGVNANNSIGKSTLLLNIWGQSVEALKDIIEKFTVSGDMVCDFMVGGGSTAVAAALSNRRFVGCDIDPVAVKTTTQRINTLFGL